MASVLSGTPELVSKTAQQTHLVIQNSYPFQLTLFGSKDLYGNEDPPKLIQPFSTAQFTYSAGENAVEILVYTVKLEAAPSKEGEGYWWVIAWSNRPNKWNQVYTTFVHVGSKIDFDAIRRKFDELASNVSTAEAEGSHLSATLVIDRYSSSPTLTAVLIESVLTAAKSDAKSK